METNEIDRAVAQLSKELDYTHDAFMAVHKFLEAHSDPDVQLDCMKAAARLMQANAATALSLKRLKSDEARFAFRYIHEGVPPTPRKLKTNGPTPVDPPRPANLQELWEDPETGEWLAEPPKP